jgi:hypothetical protein
MKAGTAWLGLGICAAALAAAQGIVFSDKAGNMDVRGLSSWRTTRLDQTKARFVGKGSPLTARWKRQGVQFVGRSIEGLIQEDQGGSYRLSSATVGGGVTASLERADEKGNPRKTTLTAPTVKFDGARDLVEATGGVGVTSVYAADEQVVTLKGSRASLTLYPSSSRNASFARSGSIDGPVTMTLETLYREPKGQKAPRKVNMVARCNRLTFDDASKTIRLEGDVEIEGSDPTTGGLIQQASEAIVTVDEKWQVVEIEFKGEPGVTRYNGKP